MDEASKRMMNEWMLFLPQGGVRRRPKKVPLSFSALARGALQAPGCAEDRHSPPAGLPEGRRRQWCARRIDDERTWVKQRDTKGSWIVDRGSWIEDPKCPVLPGILRRSTDRHQLLNSRKSVISPPSLKGQDLAMRRISLGFCAPPPPNGRSGCLFNLMSLLYTVQDRLLSNG